ncbi:MAG: hypothetical protein FJX54_22340, partial [Alphaproteobacteria bacterium]|nr:hypothetical protein [Alphaproteobacteria bacterium]
TAPLRTVLRIVVELQVSDRWGGFANAAFPLIVHAGRGQAAVVAVSVTDAGIGADGPAGVSALSEDGQVVAFQVSSTNLVPSDSAPVPEVFRYDAASGRLARFSTGSFMGTIAGPANGWSGSVAVSADGRAIAFASDAPNVGLPWGNGFRQVWVADATLPRASTITPSPAAASTAADGSLADRAADNPALSDDGRWVAFDSDATNLVAGITTIARRVYRKDRASGAVVLVGDGRRPAISADGRHVAYDDGKSVYRRDLASDSAVEIGAGIAAKMSRDGRFVAFQSGTRVLRKDLATGAIDTVSANGTAPAISGDGRFVAFVALGQVWVRDAIAARTALVSTNPSGRTANGVSAAPAISGDGRFVSFASQATDLAAGLGAGQLCLAGNPLRAPLASGWWWNPDMPGTGFALESAGDRVMLGGFFYDAVGSPIWYLGAGMQSATAASAALNLYRGGQTMDGSYRAAGLLGAVGTAEMIPLSLHTARLSGAHAAELRRYEFAPGGLAAGPQPGSPENGWWWNPDEPGTGWYLEIQNATLFLAGFLYGEDGDPRWLMSRGPMSSTRLYAGSLLGYGGGQMLGGSYRAAVQGASLGTVTLAFASPLAGTLTLPTGRQVPLRRFRF